MSITLTAHEKSNIDWKDLNQRLTQDPSIANSPNKVLKMHPHQDGSVTISANHNFPGLSSRSEQQAAADFLKDVAQRQLGADSSKAFQEAGIPDDAAVRAGKLGPLNAAVESLTNRQDEVLKVAQWDNRQRQSKPIQLDGFGSGTPLENLNDPHASVRPAGAGAGGALLVTNSEEANKGMLIKAEHPLQVQGSACLTRIARHVQQNADGQLPFQVPDFETLDMSDEDLVNNIKESYKEQSAELQQQLNADDLDDEEARKLKTTKATVDKALKSIEKGDRAFGRMELVQGAVQMNDLPFEDKLAMFKGDEFAQRVGQAMVIGPMLGQNDHFGPAASNNPSNFLVNPESGAWAAVDPAVHVNADETFGRRNGAQRIADLKQFADDPSGGPQGHARQTMDSILGFHEDAFFKAEEEARFNASVTPQDKQRFRDNLAIGVGKGLDTVARNINVFEQAYQEEAGRLNVSDSNLRPIMGRDQMEQIATTLGVKNKLQTDLHLGDGPKQAQAKQKPLKLKDDPDYKGFGSSQKSDNSVQRGVNQSGNSLKS